MITMIVVFGTVVLIGVLYTIGHNEYLKNKK